MATHSSTLAWKVQWMYHGGALADTEGIGKKHDHQTKNKGDAGADVAIGVAGGRNLVHPLFRGDLREHGVIENDAGREADLRDDEDGQERQPAPGEAQGRAADASIIFLAELVEEVVADVIRVVAVSHPRERHPVAGQCV